MVRPGMTRKLVVIGGGKMGEALVGGLVTAGWADAGEMVVVEASETRREELAEGRGLAGRHPGLMVVDPDDAAALDLAGAHGADGALIAVKPADARKACELAGRLGVGRLLSIAAGVPMASLEAWSGATAPTPDRPAPVVIRAMPNTPALLCAGASAVAAGPGVDEEHLRWAETVLTAVGVVVRVDESALDAVTGLSGSGPAYVFLMAEALIDAGVLVGLARPVAAQLAIQTMLGSAQMLVETGQSPAELRAAVTSPGGTTAAGLRVLEAAAVRSAVIEAVAAATERAREIGRQT